MRPFLVVLLCAAWVHAQVPPEKVLATMKAGDGLQVELFAAEPMVVNPTNMDIDPLGRVWITEAVNYRCKMFKKPLNRSEGDRIVILTDKDGDGKADESTVFYQGPELYGPLGICIIPFNRDAKRSALGYRVLVSQSPDILEFWDRDGDGKADGPPSKFLSGFGGYDHDHGVHSIQVGPDGKFYFTVGDQGFKNLKSSDGKKTFTQNRATMQAGTVWRCDPDGKNLEMLAHNFRNPYEACVDSFGEIWLSDNDDDGNQQTRICHVMPGGNYGYWPRGDGESHWHEEQPGIVPKTLRTGFGSPCGITCYEGALLPEKFRGQLIHADAGPREIRAFHKKPKGAGYELDKTLMLTSTDNWFRPSDVCVAPDGSVFVCDWYDPGVGGHGMGDTTRGRVYRITPAGHNGYKNPQLTIHETKFVEGLSSPCQSTRSMAFYKLNNLVITLAVATKALMDAKDEPTKEKFLNDPKIKEASNALHDNAESFAVNGNGDRLDLIARLIWATCASNRKHWNNSPFFNVNGWVDVWADDKSRNGQILLTLLRIDRNLGDNDFFHNARYSLYPIYQTGNNNLPNNSLEAITRDPKLFVTAFGPSVAARRELLMTLRTLEMDFAKPVLTALVKEYDGQDRYYLAALNIACGTDPARRDAILADFDKHFPEWNDKVAELVFELRPKVMMPKLDGLLKDAKLTDKQKGRIVDILATEPGTNAGKSLLAILTSNQSPQVKAKVIDMLKLYLPTKWSALKKSPELKEVTAKLMSNQSQIVTGIGLAAITHDQTQLPAILRLAKMYKTESTERKAAISALGEFRDTSTLREIMCIRNDPFAPQAAMLLGQIANVSKPDDEAKFALDYLIRKIEKNDDEAKELTDAILASLAGSKAGSQFLLKRHAEGDLRSELVPEAGRLVRNSPFQSIRNKALILFPAVAKLDLKTLPSPAELAKHKGDVKAGRVVFLASFKGEAQCMKCHTVHKEGGAIGPDLSAIGKKASRENLYESILQPSKAIADQFVTWKVETDDGATATGLLVKESPTEIVIRDANGKDYTIAVKSIEKKTKTPTSLMADDTAKALTEQELVDLVEYLFTLKE